MSKLHLINEIATVVKMATPDFDEVKLQIYLDDLLSNYQVVEKDDNMHEDDTDDLLYMYKSSMKLESYSECTIQTYIYELQRYRQHINKPITKATTADVRQYLAAHSHLKASTIGTKLSRIAAFYAWLVREEVILKSPTSKLKTPKTPKKVRSGVSIEELEIIRESCTTLRQRALIEVFYSTGCRLSEVRRMNKDHIDWLSSSLKVLGKGNKERIVYISPKATLHLKRYLDARTDDCEALFITDRTFLSGDTYKHHRLSNAGIRYQLSKISGVASINSPFSAHIIRHTFAQLMMDAGIDLADLQQLMGHERPETTQRYASVSEERKREAHRKFHMQ